MNKSKKKLPLGGGGDSGWKDTLSLRMECEEAGPRSRDEENIHLIHRRRGVENSEIKKNTDAIRWRSTVESFRQVERFHRKEGFCNKRMA